MTSSRSGQKRQRTCSPLNFLLGALIVAGGFIIWVNETYLPTAALLPTSIDSPLLNDIRRHTNDHLFPNGAGIEAVGKGETQRQRRRRRKEDADKDDPIATLRNVTNFDPATIDELFPEDRPTPFSDCSAYRGILHISGGDKGAAAGTVFFQYVINQLLYAELYKLIPWIHFNNVSVHVWDPEVHGVGSTSISVVGRMHTYMTRGHIPKEYTGQFPSKPFYKQEHMKRQMLEFSGTGVWKHYFEPVSAFDPSDPACQSLPVASLQEKTLTPGLQFFSVWSVRSWPYKHIPPYLRPEANPIDKTLKTWYGYQRRRAHRVVEQYYRFQPHLIQAAEALVPTRTSCLAMHVRHTDKAGYRRRKLDESEFFPYVKAYIDNGGDKVYLATDSSIVLESMLQEDGPWAELGMRDRLVRQRFIVRSEEQKAVFMKASHHRTNTEILVEILAMSRCQFMLHGFSAVSESAHYLNIDLHHNSVDLEDPDHIDSNEFGKLVEKELTKGSYTVH